LHSGHFIQTPSGTDLDRCFFLVLIRDGTIFSNQLMLMLNQFNQLTF